MPHRPTGADRYFADRAKSPGFRTEYQRTRAEIAAVDDLIRSLDETRQKLGLSKAELGRRANMAPEAVRRIFAARRSNPTLDTLVKIANALEVELQFLPKRQREKRKIRASV